MSETRTIECSFEPTTRSAFVTGEETRLGRYSQSSHWDVKGFGETKWVILGYLALDWVKEKQVYGKTEDSIVDGCLAFLNIPEEKKKNQKKPLTPKYGCLEKYRADFKIENNKPYIIVQFITNERKNENFWNEGPGSK